MCNHNQLFLPSLWRFKFLFLVLCCRTPEGAKVQIQCLQLKVRDLDRVPHQPQPSNMRKRLANPSSNICSSQACVLFEPLLVFEGCSASWRSFFMDSMKMLPSRHDSPNWQLATATLLMCSFDSLLSGSDLWVENIRCDS